MSQASRGSAAAYLGAAASERSSSWFYSALRHSELMHRGSRAVGRLLARLDHARTLAGPRWDAAPRADMRRLWPTFPLGVLGGMALVYGTYRAWSLLIAVTAAEWLAIAIGVGATALRVLAALLIAMAWTVPLGVAIGTRPHLAARVQPVVQMAASVPATALFPVVLVMVLGLPGGMNLAAVLLMLMGTQWYLLFNVIAGATAIPKDLQYTAALLQLSCGERWRILFLPALFPYLITGAITASGGAWNASIVAEYFDFGGQPGSITGVGALIAEATAAGLYPLLLAATLAMILAVTLINRLIWRRLHRLAEERHRLE